MEASELHRGDYILHRRVVYTRQKRIKYPWTEKYTYQSVYIVKERNILSRKYP